MALTDSAEEARKNFEKLQKLATSLRKDLSGLNLGDTVRDAETVKELLNGWGKEFQDSLASIDSIGASFQQTVAEISKGNVGLNQTKKSFNKLTSLASDLTNHTRGYNKLSVKQLESITSQAQQEKKRLETTLDTLKAEKASLIESRRQGNQTQESLNKIRQINSAISEAEGLIKNENSAYEDLLTNAQALAEKQGKINDAMGLGGTALEGMVSAMDKMGMGGLSEKLGLDEAKKKMEEMAEEQYQQIQKNLEEEKSLTEQITQLRKAVNQLENRLSDRQTNYNEGQDMKAIISRFKGILRQLETINSYQYDGLVMQCLGGF